jgi:hypothetical protein
MYILCLSRTGRANKGIERDAPDVAPLDKGGLASQIRNENWVCAILGEGKRGWAPRESLRHHVPTGLAPSSTLCWLSQGHRWLPSGDATRMMPQPPFIEHGTDPTLFTSVGI